MQRVTLASCNINWWIVVLPFSVLYPNVGTIRCSSKKKKKKTKIQNYLSSYLNDSLIFVFRNLFAFEADLFNSCENEFRWLNYWINLINFCTRLISTRIRLEIMLHLWHLKNRWLRAVWLSKELRLVVSLTFFLKEIILQIIS